MKQKKVWKIPPSVAIPDELTQAGYTPLLAAVLAARGFTDPEQVRRFLDGGAEILGDPLLMTDIGPAIGRIMRALGQQEKVAVYGDYDVDGITSASLLTDYLRRMGLHTEMYIPDRLEEGYGLNLSAIKRLREDGVSLIITVDCGVTAVEETEYAASLGLDMIITDHHECREILPNAVAVVDPKRPDCAYPGRDLAGVGVAFKLVCALDGNTQRVLDLYADLVAVGTVADVMPLTGENRYIVRMGLEKLRRNPRPGLAALMNEVGIDDKKISSSAIGYTLAPRINAAGRLGRVEHAAKLMMETIPRAAARLAEELCEMNLERQRLEQETWANALELLHGEEPDTPIVLAGEGWHQGVIGIAASRLSETYGVPSIMISLDGNHGKGSCRSYGGFNLFDALSSCGDLLETYGGHMLAAGLNIRRENIDAFRDAITAYYVEHVPDVPEGPAPDIEITDASLLTPECVQSLDILEPCGSENPRPLFYMHDVFLVSVTPISAGRHMRLSFEKFGQTYEAVWFSHRMEDLGFSKGDRVDLIFQLQINEFRGRRSVQLLMQDIRPTDCSELCTRILTGQRYSVYLPIGRGLLGAAWHRLENAGPVLRLPISQLGSLDPRITAEQAAVCLRIFHEVELLTVKLSENEAEITIYPDRKADLEQSPTWRRFRSI